MPGQPSHTCQLTLAAQPGGLDAIHNLVDSLWELEPQLSATDRIRFETAVIEIAGNIIEHATAGPPEPKDITIELRLSTDPDRLTACFHDDGGPAEVDLAEAPMPDAMAEYGRGISLARALVDDLTYQRPASTNIWTLTCLRSDPDP